MTPEAAIVAQIRQHCPGQAIRYGVDWKGCYAQVGDEITRAGPGGSPADALRAALAKASGGAA